MSRINAVTRKDHFPLPFIDQVLERVSGHPFYCFLEGYSGYFQIEIDVEDEEACLIEVLVQEHIEKLMEENVNEFFFIIAKEERFEVATKWKEKCIIQSLNSVENDEESKKGEVEIKKPELKPLPHGLKYFYLEKMKKHYF